MEQGPDHNIVVEEKKLNPPVNRKLSFWLVAICIVVVILFIIRFCSTKTPTNTTNNHPQPVVVSAAKIMDVPFYLSALGSVTPLYSVTVKTQINGRLINVLFKEGQMVKKGELIAQIDPTPYQAQLTQYQGQLERDQALLANAKVDLQRYQKLWTQDSVAKQVLDTQVSLVKQYEGVVLLDQGLIDGVKVNLGYCEIVSPVDGRVGLRLVDPGNYVQVTDTTGIAVINTLNPITAIFTLPEDNLPEVMRQMNLRKPLTVEAYDRTQNKLLATGTLMTIDNQIDPTTGTVKLKAEFENKDLVLFPSQFVNIQLLVKLLPKSIVIPTSAIQHGAQQTFVYLLQDDQTVRVGPVLPGITYGNLTVIKLGVKPGQYVVVDGTDKLTEGTKVTATILPTTIDKNLIRQKTS